MIKRKEVIPCRTTRRIGATDVDVFSSKHKDSKKTAHAIAHLLAKRGIQGLRVVPAKHKGTFSVRLDRDPVVDVTWVPGNQLARLRRANDYEGHKVRGAPVAYLKMCLHYELSRPASFIERWRKVWPRLRSLYEKYPEVKCPSDGDARGGTTAARSRPPRHLTVSTKRRSRGGYTVPKRGPWRSRLSPGSQEIPW